MRKKIFMLLAAVAMMCASAVTGAYAYELEPQVLEFEEVGGGKYIYCNNAEAVFADKLANGDTPSYIMNNEDMGPDMYYLYISHFNYVNYPYSMGFDVELDVELTAKEDSVINIKRTGFDSAVPYYMDKNGQTVKDENEWECLQACSDMWGDIFSIDGGYMYRDNAVAHTENYFEFNRRFNTERTVKKGETIWLSEYIRDYHATPALKPMHMQALLEIVSGKMDINVCVFKSGEKVGDRTGFDGSKLAFGSYSRDRTQKGVADTLPAVETELRYTINDEVEDGTLLPVTVYNQYVPEGNTVTEWCTHLNPQDDIWSKTIAAERDLLTFKYKDDSKLELYGENVPEEERDNVWILDAYHSDAREWYESSGMSREDFIPNAVLDVDRDNQGYGCSMGNYGVLTTYHIRIDNQGEKTRYLEYIANTASNIIVYTGDDIDLTDNTSHTSYCKGLTMEADSDIMASAELPAGEVTDVYISVNLPVNTYGGVKNSFKISDVDEFDPQTAQYYEKESRYIGTPMSDIELPEATKETLAGNLRNYDLLEGEDGYIARPCSWDARPAYCYNGWDYMDDIYILDKAKNIIGMYTFPSPSTEGSAVDGVYYIKTVNNGWYTSKDGFNWTAWGGTELPRSNERSLESIIGLYEVGRLIYNNTGQIRIEDESYKNIIKTALSSFDFEKSQDDRAKTDAYPVFVFTNGEDEIFIGADYAEYGDEVYKVKEEDRDLFENFFYTIYCNFELFEEPGRYSPSDWAADDILTAYEYGIVPQETMLLNIHSDHYTQNITRAEFARFAYRMLECMDKTPAVMPESVFTDTEEPYPTVLNSLGIINGYGDGTFGGGNSITREEAAAILVRTAKFLGLSDSFDTHIYTDDAEVSDWAKADVSAASNLGIMLGVGDNRFEPQGAYTVEQAIVTMLRLYNNTVITSGLPETPESELGQTRMVIYREGYRNDRIELAFYNGEEVTLSDGVLGSGDYRDDEKYYLSCGRWLRFETDAPAASNLASEVIRIR